MPPHNRPLRPQHRVSASRRCTGATRPVEWALTALQGLTRGFTTLGCGFEPRLAAIRRKNHKKPVAYFQIL